MNNDVLYIYITTIIYYFFPFFPFLPPFPFFLDINFATITRAILPRAIFCILVAATSNHRNAPSLRRTTAFSNRSSSVLRLRSASILSKYVFNTYREREWKRGETRMKKRYMPTVR